MLKIGYNFRGCVRTQFRPSRNTRQMPPHRQQGKGNRQQQQQHGEIQRGSRRLWVVGCGLWVVGCGLWVVGCGLWVVGCGLRVVGCGLWVVRNQL